MNREQMLSIFNKERVASSDRIYLAPNIPYDKLNNAIKAFEIYDINRDDILLIADNTVFRSAKDGILITTESIYSKEKFSDFINKINFDDIEIISLDGQQFAIVSEKYNVRTGQMKLLEWSELSKINKAIKLIIESNNNCNEQVWNKYNNLDEFREGFEDFKKNLIASLKKDVNDYLHYYHDCSNKSMPRIYEASLKFGSRNAPLEACLSLVIRIDNMLESEEMDDDTKVKKCNYILNVVKFIYENRLNIINTYRKNYGLGEDGNEKLTPTNDDGDDDFYI